MTKHLKLLILLLGVALFTQSCGDDDDDPMIGVELPEVSASFTQDVQSDTGVVAFTNTSENANSFSWTFGDGGTSTDADPTYTYTMSGTFTVTLTASNAAGDSDTAESTVIIEIPDPVEPFDSGLVANGDFESVNGSGNLEGWILGVDPNNLAPATEENGNTFYSVNVDNPDPSQVFLVNLSQLIEIQNGNVYRLQFDAWSDTDRSIIAGIGLSDGDFSNNSESVDITTTPMTYELVLCANNFGAENARILFDLNGEAGMVGIDNVALFLDDDSGMCAEEVGGGGTTEGEFGIIQNGDWEATDDSGNVTNWIVGVDDNDPAPTEVVDGNRFYSVNITEPDPGQPFLVNTSQRVEIVMGTTYILEFQAWSDMERNIIAGIGLSSGSFANNSEMVAINTTPTVYTLTLEATDFGASDARVLFDVNGEAGMVGIDNVTLNIQ